jgi:TorA maturation chaperone TorD
MDVFMQNSIPESMKASTNTSPGVSAGEDAVRGNTYGLLAHLLSEPPTAETLALLIQIDVSRQTSNALELSWNMLRLASEQVSIEQLDDEFHDLFIGVGRGEVVPYGSWYMTGFLMDRSLSVLRHDLAELGIERQQGVSEPEDHAAALCDAMAILINDAQEPSLQSRFFNTHIAPWMGRFFNDLQTAKTARFYRVVGRLGEQFIEFEKKYLKMFA